MHHHLPANAAVADEMRNSLDLCSALDSGSRRAGHLADWPARLVRLLLPRNDLCADDGAAAAQQNDADSDGNRLAQIQQQLGVLAAEQPHSAALRL